MSEIEKNTNTVEEFIIECLNQDIDYDTFFKYLTTIHKG